jgi:hypothetical protein
MVTITKILALKSPDIFLCKENNQPIKRSDLFSQKKTNLSGQKTEMCFRHFMLFPQRVKKLLLLSAVRPLQ